MYPSLILNTKNTLQLFVGGKFSIFGKIKSKFLSHLIPKFESIGPQIVSKRIFGIKIEVWKLGGGDFHCGKATAWGDAKQKTVLVDNLIRIANYPVLTKLTNKSMKASVTLATTVSFFGGSGKMPIEFPKKLLNSVPCPAPSRSSCFKTSGV